MSLSSFNSAEERAEITSYDPDFSVDISKKMTVPNKIKAVEGAYNEILDDPAILAMYGSENNHEMNVPDCIRVAGGESHITTTREPPPEMKLEDKLFGKTNDSPLLQLSTPPRTLRYEDAEPIFAEPIQRLDKALNSSSNKFMDSSSVIVSRFNTDVSVMDYEDGELSSQNFIQLRRRILQLSRRIDAIEIENRHRNKRDLLLYALGALYLLFRGLSWFASSGGGGRNRFTF